MKTHEEHQHWSDIDSHHPRAVYGVYVWGFWVLVGVMAVELMGGWR